MTNIKQALEDLKAGKLIVVLDDLDRENEGDLIGIAEYMNPESINFMITHGRGLLCSPVSKQIAVTHKLQLAPQKNSDGTNFMLSIDSANSITGISAFERFECLQNILKDENSNFRTPGHLFPLLAREGGLSKRRGHTEATVDLAKLIGAKEVGAIVEIVGDDGEMLRGKELLQWTKEKGMTFITIEDLVKYIEENRKEIWDINEVSSLEFSSSSVIPTKYGKFNIKVVKDTITGNEAIMYWMGEIKNDINVRVHSMCVTSEVFHSERCDCRGQLNKAFEIIRENNSGLVIYTFDEGRDIGIFNKINAYKLQDDGMDTKQANIELGFADDQRTYDLQAEIIKHHNISSINLFSNNPNKINSLKDQGIKVNDIRLWTKSTDESDKYIQTKINKMNHIK